jgi:Tol biopolymer transport system component
MATSDGKNFRNISNYPKIDYIPKFSPDGKKIVFYSNRKNEKYDIYTMKSNGTEFKNLSNTEHVSEFYPSFSPDGTKILFTASGPNLNGVFTMDTTGNNINQISNTYSLYPKFSPDGLKVLCLKPDSLYIFTVNINGFEKNRLTYDYPARYPEFSPDGSMIVYEAIMDKYQVMIMKTDGSDKINLTNNNNNNFGPKFFPDNENVLFLSGGNIFMINKDSKDIRQISNTKYSIRSVNISLDGEKIVFISGPYIDYNNVFIVNSDGSNQINLTNSKSWYQFPSFSPIIQAIN